MNFVNRLTLLLSLAFLACPQITRAEVSAGAMLGPSFESHGLGTQIAYGLHVDDRISQIVSFGVYGTHQNLGGSDTNTLHATILAAELNIHPDVGFPFYFGAKGGVGFFHDSAATNAPIGDGKILDQSNNKFVYGPALGFDLPFSEELSFGIELNGLIGSLPNANQLMVNLLVAATYHL